MISLQLVVFDNREQDWYKSEEPTEHNIFILVTGNRLSYRLDGEVFQLEKGDLLYIPQGTLRFGMDDVSGPHQKYSAHFYLKNESVLPLKNPNKPLKVRTRHFDYLKQRFTLLYQHWFGQLPHFQYIGEGMVIEMLGQMAREVEMNHFSTAKLRLVEEAQAYLIERYREPVRLEEIAVLLDRSPNYITQIFKEIIGLTPITYVHHLRVQAARELILASGMTIGQVSDYLGFSDQAYFNRVFKKITGHPPSAVYDKNINWKEQMNR